MRADPEMRGTSGGSDVPEILAPANSPLSNSRGDDLHNVIERIVVRTCFKSAHSGADAADTQPPRRGDTRLGTARGSAPASAAMCDVEIQARPAERRAPAIANVKRFIAVLDKVYAKLLTGGDFDFVGFLRARSLGPSEMLDLLEACAVRLGEEWSCDNLGFVRVTVAMSRLQRILAVLSQENRCFEQFACDRSMLIILPRGEMHLFAVNLIEERFRLNGWQVRLASADGSLDLPHLLKTGDLHLVCLAWLDSTLKNRVESVLHAIRTSVNRDRTCVIAGGPAAEEYSHWLEERGVEKICSNAQIALETAERLGATRNSTQMATGINGSLLEPLRSA